MFDKKLQPTLGASGDMKGVGLHCFIFDTGYTTSPFCMPLLMLGPGLLAADPSNAWGNELVLCLGEREP